MEKWNRSPFGARHAMMLSYPAHELSSRREKNQTAHRIGRRVNTCGDQGPWSDTVSPAVVRLNALY